MIKKSVTIEEVKANMQDVICKTAVEFDKPVTYVTVRMKNGFTIRESTTCVDPANYDEEIGKQICLEKIEDKVWMLLGYNLQTVVSAKNQELASTRDMMVSEDYKERFKAEYIQLKNRYEGLKKMVEKWDEGKLEFTPTCSRDIYDVQLDAMRKYMYILVSRAKIEDVEL